MLKARSRIVSLRERLDVVEEVAWISEHASYASASWLMDLWRPDRDSWSIEAAIDGWGDTARKVALRASLSTDVVTDGWGDPARYVILRISEGVGGPSFNGKASSRPNWLLLLKVSSIGVSGTVSMAVEALEMVGGAWDPPKGSFWSELGRWDWIVRAQAFKDGPSRDAGRKSNFDTASPSLLNTGFNLSTWLFRRLLRTVYSFLIITTKVGVKVLKLFLLIEPKPFLWATSPI